MQTLIKEDNYESESQSDLTPGIQDIKKFVYSPYGESETSESEFDDNNNYPISLEELEQEEIKTKRPPHQRPLTKLFMVALALIPVFAFLYLFIGGTKKPAQIARAIQESQTDKELLAQNQKLQEQLDQMQLELARLKQEKETPPTPTPKTQPPPKVVKPPAPKPQPKPVAPVRTVAARRPAPPRERPFVRQTPPPPKPTAEDLMSRRQLLAQSMVLGGSIGESELEPVYESEIESNSIPSATLVSTLQTDSNAPIARTEEIDFEITSPNSTAEEINQNHQQFTPGTSISAKSLHPAFFGIGNSTTVNMEVTDSNTPVPKGTNLSVELQEVNGAVRVTSIQAQVDNQVWDLEASHWQVTAKDGMPLVPASISRGNSRNGRPLRNTASNVLRNTRQVYRTDDPLTSTLIGVGSAIVDGELNRNNFNTSQGNQRSNIRVIEENTPIKLYVIQGFGL